MKTPVSPKFVLNLGSTQKILGAHPHDTPDDSENIFASLGFK